MLLVMCVLNLVSQVNIHKNIDSILTASNDSLKLKVTFLSPTPKILKADSMILFGKKYLGLNYKRGGTSNRGYDCSGYTMTVFRKFGIKLPHTSAGQGLVGMEVNSKNIQKGDLIFFKGRSRRRQRIGHVGIVISERGKPVKFIHSSVSDGVREDWLQSDYYRKRFVKVMRIANWVQ